MTGGFPAHRDQAKVYVRRLPTGWALTAFHADDGRWWWEGWGLSWDQALAMLPAIIDARRRRESPPWWSTSPIFWWRHLVRR